MSIIADGKLIAEKNILELKTKIKKSNFKTSPIFVIIQIGRNSESNLYIKNKKTLAENLGFILEHYKFDSDIKTKNIIKKIKELNENNDICGIMVQLPLPKKLNTNKILNSISVNKDIDGLNKKNQNSILNGKSKFISPTALSVESVLDFYNINIKNRDVIVVGKGRVAGKPISLLMKKRGGNVKVITKRNSYKLEKNLQYSDIVISAVGKENLIKKRMVSKDAVLIDVGTKIKNGKLVGDLDFNSLKDNVFLITPTPGGIGVITVSFLMSNVLKAYKLNS
ncbi:MAG: bifunctional protein FolD [Candidatus Hepatoplasma vulgare]|nr:MAG: bifunctional protein FolD [Candidatus Hepatoplasma sp.]